MFGRREGEHHRVEAGLPTQLEGGGGSLFGGRDPFKEFSSFKTRGIGKYSSQTFAMSSVVGPDGHVKTERYASTDVGNSAEDIAEMEQAYSNTATGVEKFGHERHLGKMARKTVEERFRQGDHEDRKIELYSGMNETGRERFNEEFAGKAHHLPQDPPRLFGNDVCALTDVRRPVGWARALPLIGASNLTVGTSGGERIANSREQ
eukprot:TRINITY_DN4257_c0_g1_i1.p1 TRINITY_DN4257_c0_g1~~TRINITY_DN4257_c0_g1_i1.p1  ORF type:complete len:205 (-),score=33.16 TRINITY_DN4257_c0_g1_i1:506-1120(-)